MSQFCLRTIAIAILIASAPIWAQNVSHSHSQHTLPSSNDGSAAVAHNRTAKNVPSTIQPDHQSEYHTTQHGSDSLNLTNVLRLENVLEVFNIRDVAKLWEQHATDQITTGCANDMHAYLHGLQQLHLWATKSKSNSYVSLFYITKNSNNGGLRVHLELVPRALANSDESVPWIEFISRAHTASYHTAAPMATEWVRAYARCTMWWRSWLVNGKNVPKMKDFDDFFHNKRVFVLAFRSSATSSAFFFSFASFVFDRFIIIYLVVFLLVFL